jgi:hypothetical protein
MRRRSSAIDMTDAIEGGGGGGGKLLSDDANATTTLTASEWRFLATAVRMQTFAANAEIVESGRAWKGGAARLYQLVQGRVKFVRKNLSSRQQALLGVQGRLSLLAVCASAHRWC